MAEKMLRFTCVVTDFVEPDLEWERAQYRDAGVVYRTHQLRLAGPDEIAAAAAEADVLIVDQARITADVIGRLGRCRLIIRHGDGYDNLDLEAATRAGIVCCNEPGFWSREVAEQAFVLGLALALKIPVQQAVARKSRTGTDAGWNLHEAMPYRRLGTLTVGILGCGKIGVQTARLYLPLVEEVLICDPLVDHSRIRDTGAVPVDWEVLLDKSDLISIHVPATAGTRGLFDRTVFGRMKKGALLVNTARGSIVDTEAVADALESGRLGGAALDSTVPEPLPGNHRLFGLPNVIITPHMGWYSEDALGDMRHRIVSDVLGAAEGRLPASVVNPEVLTRSNLRLKTPAR